MYYFYIYLFSNTFLFFKKKTMYRWLFVVIVRTRGSGSELVRLNCHLRKLLGWTRLFQGMIQYNKTIGFKENANLKGLHQTASPLYGWNIADAA